MLILIFWPLKWWCRLEVQGIETIPESGAVLVVSNHDSWMDPLALGAAIMTRDRPLRFLAKASLWHTWIQRVLLDGMGQIPIERGIGDTQAMQAAIDALAAGDAVGIFPEGTISRGRPMRARRGVARLAQGAPSAAVVLAAVSGGTDAIRFPKRPHIVVDLFEPGESSIAPGDGAALTALGGTPGTSEVAGTARDEWWVPLVLLLLVVLAAEWLLYERDGARRIAQGIRARLSRTPSGRATTR